MIWITRFPLPPSVNEYLMAVKGRLVKTGVHRRYRDECHLWAAQNRASFEHVRRRLLDYKEKAEFHRLPAVFKLDCYFVFHYERIFTVKRKVQQLDADNRLKPLRDGLSEILGIDDKHFFAGNCEKVTTREKALECAILRLELMKPRTVEEINSVMRVEMSTPASS